jgi:hypothetical protein
MKFLFLVCLASSFLVNGHAKTNVDLMGGLQGRTLPSFGAEIYAEAGYNKLLWGKKKEKKDFKYGLIRPSVGASTSGVINSFKAEIEFFPISILGFSAGRQIIHSNFNFPFFDCSQISCTGQFERNFIESKMVLGFNHWVAVGHYKLDRLSSPDSNRPMADWRNVIIGEADHEIQIEKKLLIGKMIAQELIGVMYEHVQFQGSREMKESFMGVYQMAIRNNLYLIGAGTFQTNQQPLGLQIYFRIHHVSLPSLKLF